MKSHLTLTHLTLAALLALSASLPTHAQAPTPDASRVFPFEAPILGGVTQRVAYLPIPTEVLEEAAPNLADVRVHSASGQELPYVVDSGARASRTATRVIEDARILRTDRRIERGPSLAPTYVERFEVSMPSLPSDLADGAWSTRRWTLHLETPHPRYVAQVQVLFAATERQTPLADGSVYRFPDPTREGAELVLGYPPELPSEQNRLIVEVRGEAGYLEPTLRFSTQTERMAPQVLSVPLEVLASGSEGGVTTVRLARPAGVMPDRLTLHTSTANFHRQVTVSDDAQGRPTVNVGSGLAYRLAEVSGAEVLSVGLRRMVGQALLVRIEDQDSPPLEQLTFSAEVTQPVLAFTSEPGAVLRFGGGRVRAPVYDLMRVRSGLLGDGALVDPALEAHLGEITPNPNFDAGPALAFAFAPGRAVALAGFISRATVEVSSAREGLSRLDLSPALLSAAQESLADVRIVDEAGRQRPYVLGAPETREVELSAPSAHPIGERSEYALILPAELVRVNGLRFATDAALVAREYRLYATKPNGREVTLTHGFFARAPDTHERLAVDFPATRVRALRLEVTDGGDAPLAFTGATLQLEAQPLFLIAPDGAYLLYCGDESLTAPVYEVAQARALVLSLPAAPAMAGEPMANAAHVAPAWYQGDHGQTWLVWGALLFALLVLVFLTVRVVRSVPEEPAPEPTPESAPEPASEPAPEASAEASPEPASSAPASAATEPSAADAATPATPADPDAEDGQEGPAE